MSIMHHPDDATLLAFASGSIGEALGAVVASHADMCPACRKSLARMAMLGGVLMEKAQGVPLQEPRFVADTVAPSTKAAEPRSIPGDLPRPLARLLGGASLDAITWKRMARGVQHHPLPLSKGASGSLSLLRIEPGHGIPDHGHGGAELTLVLKGSYKDAFGRYARGDVEDADGELEHKPFVDSDEVCICLAASESIPRFKGWRGLVVPLLKR
jgi:putative transcriptional regulator